jgi:hypothetical protein
MNPAAPSPFGKPVTAIGAHGDRSSLVIAYDLIGRGSDKKHSHDPSPPPGRGHNAFLSRLDGPGTLWEAVGVTVNGAAAVIARIPDESAAACFIAINFAERCKWLLCRALLAIAN